MMNIEAYDFGTIRVGGATYTSDVIIMPDSVKDSWWRREGHNLCIEDLTDVIATKPDVLVIGTGYYGRMKVPVATKSYLEARGIKVHIVKTGQAVKEFNELQRRIGKVIAALHLTC